MFRLIKKIFIGLFTGLNNGSNQAKHLSLSNQKCMFNLPLLICILMNTVKNLTTSHFRLN